VVPSGPRVNGTIKWFNVSKGYGFITQDSGEDVFVHYRSLRNQDRYSIKEGMAVTFVMGRSGKGPQAEDVAQAS
jgi:CspA family cold shock protein